MGKTKPQILISWSGGKDSAFALSELMQENNYEVAALLTTVTTEYDRISIHGIRRSILHRQAEATGIPFKEVTIPPKTTNEEYEARMITALEEAKSQGVETVMFGDIFLEDVRQYREDLMAKTKMKAIYPLWGQNTTELAHKFIDQGFKAKIAVVDSQVLDDAFVGREFDLEFLNQLPAGIDPCGENGEFHTFVYDGPIFKFPIAHQQGEIVFREERFYFCDFIEN